MKEGPIHPAWPDVLVRIPGAAERIQHGYAPRQIPAPDFGMTLRDYFAAHIIQGILARADTGPHADLVAKGAYCLADAMLRERNRRAGESE
jgi:hypothetical protein